MRIFTTFCTIILVVFIATSALAQESITLTNGEWPPLFSKDFKHGGIGTKICTEAFALEGVEVKYDYYPWKRSYDIAQRGKADGTVGWRKRPARERDFLFSDVIYTINSVLFHRKGSEFDWDTLDDVGAMTIGVTLGYTHVDLLRPIVERNGGKLELAPTDELNLQKLAAGRIDLFPCAESVCYYLLRTKFMPGTADLIKSHSKPILEGQLYLLISKKHPKADELIEKFNRGLKKLRDSGKYDQYVNESIRGDYLPESSELQNRSYMAKSR